MKAVIFLIVLLLCADGFPLKAKRPKRNKEEDAKKAEQEACDLAEYSIRSCGEGQHFVGSNLFDGFRKICFSLEEINLLLARREFERMIPQGLPQGLLDDKAVEDILRYFYYGIWLVDRIEDERVKPSVEKAFYDTVGGFVGYYLVPVAKFSYYASKVELKTVRHVLALYHKCRDFLNTNGNGWRPPIRDPTFEMNNVRIEPLKLIDDNEQGDHEQKGCIDLDLSTATSGVDIVDDNMIVSLPKLDLEDPEGYLNNVWLPFSRKRTFNLRSCKSAFVFVRFYRSVTSCYKQKGMERKTFDHKFRQWIVENVKVHLGDEVFYPGLGGILNVYETLRAVCNKTVGNGKREEANFAFGVDGKQHDIAMLMEEKATAYAAIIEGPNKRQRKRAINNEELEYIKALQDNMPPSEEQSADNWIKAFDESTLQEYAPKSRESVIITKCRKKCKRKKKRKKLSDFFKIAGRSTNKTKTNWFPWRTTTAKTVSLTTSLTAHSTTTHNSSNVYTTAPTTKAPKPAKPTADSESEGHSKYWLLWTFLLLIVLLLLWLCCLLIICILRNGSACCERCGECLSWFTEKITSICQRYEEEPPPPPPKKTKCWNRRPPSAKSNDIKSDKATTKGNKKTDKANKKAAKTDQKARKSFNKKTEKPEKLDKKAQRAAEKAAEKAAKDLEKGTKKYGKDTKKQDDAEKQQKKCILGIRVNPKRSHQKRAGRFYKRSLSPS